MVSHQRANSGKVSLAEEDAACALQPFVDGGIAGGDVVRQYLGPLRGSKPSDLHAVLQGERHSVQGPELIAAGDCGVGFLG